MAICRLLEIFIDNGSVKAAVARARRLYQALSAWHQRITRERLPRHLLVGEALFLGQIREQLVAVEHLDERFLEVLLVARDDGVDFQLERVLVHTWSIMTFVSTRNFIGYHQDP